MELQGINALVVGGARGIGDHVAHDLSSTGASTSLTYESVSSVDHGASAATRARQSIEIDLPVAMEQIVDHADWPPFQPGMDLLLIGGRLESHPTSAAKILIWLSQVEKGLTDTLAAVREGLADMQGSGAASTIAVYVDCDGSLINGIERNTTAGVCLAVMTSIVKELESIRDPALGEHDESISEPEV